MKELEQFRREHNLTLHSKLESRGGGKPSLIFSEGETEKGETFTFIYGVSENQPYKVEGYRFFMLPNQTIIHSDETNFSSEEEYISKLEYKFKKK